MKTTLHLLVILFFTSNALSQVSELPRHFSPGEQELMSEYIVSVLADRSGNSMVPTQPRTMAEWEELDGIVIAWSESFRDIQYEIVRNAKEQATVYILNDDEDLVKFRLDQAGVDYSTNVEFITGDYNSLWIRDYGPNSVYVNGVDSLIFVDWIYNRPRPFDDATPTTIGNYLNVPVVSMTAAPTDLVHTGGNFMSNGQGQGFSSKLVLDENGPNNNWGTSNHSDEEVRQLMNQYMGIEEYVLMDNLPFDLIHHIDMHMKMIDDEKIIVGQYPEGIADGPQIEANIQFVLETYRTAFQRDYEIIRVPMPPDGSGRYPHQGGDYRTYANALFVNEMVLVPVYEEQYDTTALRIWKEALPGHEIVGINCNSIIPLSGALHCIIKEIGVKDPIHFRHKPTLEAMAGQKSDFRIRARVFHKEEIEQVTLFYSLDDGITYDSIPMTDNGGNMWEEYIPTQIDGEVIYYLRATAESGKQVHKPLTGPNNGGIRFNVIPLSSTSDQFVSSKIGDVFPNPAENITGIPIEYSHDIDIEVLLIDANGKIVKRIFNDVYESFRKHIFFNVSDIPTGNYYLYIRTSEGVVTKPVNVVRK